MPTFFYLQIKRSKKMDANEKLELTQIKGTPFQHATNGERNYITCGKVLLETDKNLEETKEYIKEKPYELIALLAQATFIEMQDEINKTNKKQKN